MSKLNMAVLEVAGLIRQGFIPALMIHKVAKAQGLKEHDLATALGKRAAAVKASRRVVTSAAPVDAWWDK